MIELTLTPQQRLDYKRILAHKYQECVRKGHRARAEAVKNLMIEIG